MEISQFPSLGFLETPLYKGLELSEGGCFTLTQPSLNPHAGVWREVGGKGEKSGGEVRERNLLIALPEIVLCL